jgi:NAD(P)-dependent dehydrogenase (short-subunit alcohol dehydrogenase family)
MPQAIVDKTVLATGANRGLGRALVDEVWRRGARRVYAASRQAFGRGTASWCCLATSNGSELSAAQRDLSDVYPTAEDYHAAPGEGRNRAFSGDEFGGIMAFPFPTEALCRLVVCDKLSRSQNCGPSTAARPATSKNTTATS